MGRALAAFCLGLFALLCFARALWPVLTRTGCGGKTHTDLAALHFALAEYAELHGAWPDTLDALVRPDKQGCRLLDRETVPEDVWGRAYRYERSDRLDVAPHVYTLGADGAPGGSGDDRDIDNWSFLGHSR